MGRAKLKLELIAKTKQRVLTFKKRKEGLTKKLHQLSVLCDVGACMLIFDKDQNQTSTWPDQNPDQVRRLIDVYRSTDPSNVKTYGVPDFLSDRKRKAEEELQKLRKSNSEARFPTWNPAFDSMSEAHLRAVAASLLAKSQIIGSRIQAMRAREARDLEMMKTDMLLLNSSTHHYFYSTHVDHHREFKPPPPMNMQQLVPQNYYAPPPPPPMPPMPQPYMIWPANNMHYYPTMDQNPNINYYSTSMDQNIMNYWSEDADQETTRYLLQ